MVISMETAKKIGKNIQKKVMSLLEAKNLKKYFNQRTFMGVSLIGLVAFVFVYVYIYLGYMEKTEALEQTNLALKKELVELEKHYQNMASYKQGIEEMQVAVESILQEYPADAREENVVMLAVQIQEDNDITYRSINMEEQEAVYTVPHDLFVTAGVEGFETDVVFAQKHATYVNETSYEDLKECIAEVYAAKERIGIDNIVYCKNQETGMLEGNINLYFYSASGTGKAYEAPDMAEYISGTENLFQAGR